MLTLNCFLFSIAHVRNKGKTQKVSKGLSVRKIYTNVHMPQSFQPMLLNSKFLHKEGASPCTGKHFSSSSKENVLKLFFDIAFYWNISKLPIMYKRKSKNVILYEVLKTIWTRVGACQNGHATLLVGTNGQCCRSGLALFLLLRILSLCRRSNACGTARRRAGFSLLVIGWRFPLALTGLAVAPFLWRWGSFRPLLLFFGRCVGILQGSIFWITCWEVSIRFPCNWKPISLLDVDYKISSRAIIGRLLKVIHFLVANDQTCGVSGYWRQCLFAEGCDTRRLLDPIGRNPIDTLWILQRSIPYRFGFEHWL